MSKVKMQFVVDFSDAEKLQIMAEAFQKLCVAAKESPEVESTKEAEDESDAQEAPEAPKKKTRKKPTVTKAKAKEKAPEPTQDDPEDESEAEAEETEIKVEDVRSLLSGLVSDHRDAIKTKLTEMGAKNLTSLEKEKYPEFMTFLKSL